ncbi:MAG: PQQ-dependent sugar dehydrogenase [Proteobacteria bacterium]|nr:PQQ-dependent sugar dehydrogenase [Pseudomonadota bacterium]
MKKSLISALFVLGVSALVSSSFAGGHKGKSAAVPQITQEAVLTGLESPWDTDFLADGTMFFTEKCKGFSVRLPSGKVQALYGMTGSKGYADTGNDLWCTNQAGMLGIAVDPNFDKNRRIYVASASTKYHGSGCKTNFERCDGNIVMRFEVSKDFKSVSNRTDIVKDIQFKPFESDHPFGGNGAHNGNRPTFGPDGSLWITTGDRHRGVCPQSPDLMCGKVLRIDTDGNAHKGNKPPAGYDKRIYTYGHRNVQGIAFRSDGAVFTAEHGPWHNDELTMLVNGGNGGWDPRQNVGGRGECPDEYCGYSPKPKEGVIPAIRAAFMPMSDTRFADLMPPAWQNNGYSQGTSSIAFLKGKQWGTYEGRAVVGIMGIAFGGTPVGMRLDVYDIAKDGQSIKSVIHLPVEQKRYRGVTLGPDGALYANTDEGEIYKITAK